MGDGKFLSHWGKQSLSEARQLNTPHLLGESHKLLRQQLGNEPLLKPEVELDGDKLLSLRNRSASTRFEFIPEVSSYTGTPAGLIWVPGKAIFSSKPPSKGAMVLVNPVDQAPE